MDSTRNLRSRQNTIANKSVPQDKKPSLKKVPTVSKLQKTDLSPKTTNNASNKEAFVKKPIARTPVTASRPASGTKTSASANRPSLSDGSKRLSTTLNTSAQRTSTTPNAHPAVKVLSDKIAQLEKKTAEIVGLYEQLKNDSLGVQYAVAQLIDLKTKFTESEECRNLLKSENEGLRLSIAQLTDQNLQLKSEIKHITNRVTQLEQSTNSSESQKLGKEVFELKGELDNYRTSQLLAEKGISREQQEINANIVIRGVHVNKKDINSQSELIKVYDKIRTHLGISEINDLNAVSATILQPKSATNINSGSSANTIQVKLSSVSAKRKFLQIRRAKKDILPSHIGITQTSNKPILITEQLTRENQELLFKARSLRTSNNFKFVWSNDGQILARKNPGSRVVRIRDADHVNSLRLENQSQQPQNGRIHSDIALTPSTGDKQE